MHALYPFAGLIIAAVTLALMYGGYRVICLLDFDQPHWPDMGQPHG